MSNGPHQLSISPNGRWLVARPGQLLINVNAIAYVKVKPKDNKHVLYVHLLGNVTPDGEGEDAVPGLDTLRSYPMDQGEVQVLLDALVGKVKDE
jgi:hypothetical protein